MATKKLYEARAEVAKALSHPLRLEIADLLQKEEFCVCELEEELEDASQSVISRHLSVLKQAGLIESRKDGLNNYYSLRVPCVERFFSCLDQVLEKDLKEKQKDLVQEG